MLFIFSQGWGEGQFISGSGTWLFFQAAPAPTEPKTPGSGSLIIQRKVDTEYWTLIKDIASFYFFSTLLNLCIYMKEIFKVWPVTPKHLTSILAWGGGWGVNQRSKYLSNYVCTYIWKHFYLLKVLGFIILYSFKLLLSLITFPSFSHFFLLAF